MGNGQEFEVVKAKVPKGFVRDGWQLAIGELFEGDCGVQHLGKTMYGEQQWLILRPIATEKPSKPLKPNWKPPKLRKGWLTWDESCGWYWWENRPEYHAVDSWAYPEGKCIFNNEEIGSMMAEILGCPDCTGFDERNCIWEVGE